MLGMPVGYGVSATASVNAGGSAVDVGAGVDYSMGWVAALPSESAALATPATASPTAPLIPIAPSGVLGSGAAA